MNVVVIIVSTAHVVFKLSDIDTGCGCTSWRYEEGNIKWVNERAGPQRTQRKRVQAAERGARYENGCTLCSAGWG